MTTYDQARADEFTRATTTTVSGIELEVPVDSSFARDGLIAIQYCVCVTDPCECSGKIVWIAGEAVSARVDTDRKNRAGASIVELTVDPDATVLVESVVAGKAGALRLAGRRGRLNPSSHLPASRSGQDGCGCGGGGGGRGSTNDGRAAYASYDGQECAGHVMYDVYVEADGLDTTFHYVAVGSC